MSTVYSRGCLTLTAGRTRSPRRRRPPGGSARACPLPAVARRRPCRRRHRRPRAGTGSRAVPAVRLTSPLIRASWTGPWRPGARHHDLSVDQQEAAVLARREEAVGSRPGDAQRAAVFAEERLRIRPERVEPEEDGRDECGPVGLRGVERLADGIEADRGRSSSSGGSRAAVRARPGPGGRLARLALAPVVDLVEVLLGHGLEGEPAIVAGAGLENPPGHRIVAGRRGRQGWHPRLVSSPWVRNSVMTMAGRADPWGSWTFL